MHHDIPVPTIHLFSPLDQLLIELLHSLTAEEWALQTLAPAWKVKDVAAHLLAGNVRNLSISRDNFYDPSAAHISTYQDVVQYLNLINNDWVKAMQSVSPQMLITLLSITNSLYSDHLAKLDPIEKAIFPVAWAGDEESQNWFHIAREYTEKWHHQQQIRHALGHASPLFSKTFFKPYLETSLRAVPYRFRNLHAEPGDTFSLIVSGEGGGEYHFIYETDKWIAMTETPSYSVAKVHIDDQVIWRMFSNEISIDELKNRTSISGKKEIADAFIGMTAVMV
ncbi:MAG: maleylpyruvate isomerase N-terminal domain-containing protein [Saprospiraceae bacterium]|nr:maleylpyruvate isomerase N-terminal domain-containing protein [Saprospiraceae bacterium]